MALLTLVISSPGSDCIKWERKQKKGGGRCKHRPPPKMTHQQDLTKSRFKLEVRPNLADLATKPAVIVKLQGIEKGREKSCFPSPFNI